MGSADGGPERVVRGAGPAQALLEVGGGTVGVLVALLGMPCVLYLVAFPVGFGGDMDAIAAIWLIGCTGLPVAPALGALGCCVMNPETAAKLREAGWSRWRALLAALGGMLGLLAGALVVLRAETDNPVSLFWGAQGGAWTGAALAAWLAQPSSGYMPRRPS
jgi:hypothetical protein